MRNLVIVESPTKAKTIGKFLGKDYIVKSSVGHVRDLPKSKLGVDIENNFEPNYITIRGKGKVVNELRKEAKKADNIYLATDPDREGEAISWHLAHILDLDKEAKNRVEFNEITKNTVKNAINRPRKIDMNLVNAQQARRILDRLVGYKISPILWNKIRRGLSAGRVQSVTTKIICDREKEIEEFVPEEYWSLDILTTKKDIAENIKFNFYGKNNKKIELKNKEETDKIIEKINNKDLIVLKIDRKKKIRKAFRPFTTSTLQQDASSKLGFTTKKTMRIAQQLYEGINIKGIGTIGLITYMRTDSQRLSNEFQEQAKNHIIKKYGDKYYKKYSYSQKSKNVQDAHESIRPTNTEFEPMKIANSLSKDQFKLYNLIYKRALASMMQDAIYDAETIYASVDKHDFRANGSKLVFKGFMAMYDYINSDETILPILEENEKLKIIKTYPKQHFTQPPARYNEASLVKTLEELGIGRPSTYSTIISTIQDRGYVQKIQKNLHPTDLGILVTKIMEEYFTQVVDVDWTANIENSLDTIEEGNKEWRNVLNEYYTPLSQDIEKANKEIDKIDMTEATDEVCPKCGAKMVIKFGRYGKFMACSRYPECKTTKSIVEKTGIKCPICKDGDIIIRKTKKGREFYGCSNYPKCNFASWNLPTGEVCEKCGDFMVEAKGKVKYKSKCNNKNCDFKKF